MRFAHISDLHFGTITLSPFQFCSKRFAGNFNFLFKRKKAFDYDRLLELIDLFKKEGITHVFITGDVSVTAKSSEFKRARRFCQMLEKEGIVVHAIPGNHDHYTKTSYRHKRFYKFFDEKLHPKSSHSLKSHKVSTKKLKEGLWLIALDTAIATNLFSSQGSFSKKAQDNLISALKQIPKDDAIILMNHYPFAQNDATKKLLLRGSELQKLLTEHPNILLYLHGHTHRQTVADLRESDLPILSDSGSTPERKSGACHLFTIGDNAVELDVFRYDSGWKESERHTFKR